jgi:hypothetical protein
MAKRQQTVADVRESIVERLTWQVAQRDDGEVAGAIHGGEELDGVYPLGDVGLLDEFYHFLETSGVLAEFSELKLTTVKRVFVPVIQFVQLYLLKTLLGIESMNALPALLFSNVAAMKVIGFNAHQIANGVTQRGNDKRTKRPKQGPLSPQCLAQNLSKFTVAQMEGLFDAVVRILVGVVGLTGDLTVALDGSQVPTTAKYIGCGCLGVVHKGKEKGTGRIVKIVKSVFGWKVFVLIEVKTRLPLAMKVGKIQDYEGQWLVPLVNQAQSNLGTRSRISKVVIDRGYLHGDDLWQIDQLGITFVIVAKSGMAVRDDAHALAREVTPVERVHQVRHGHGRKAWIEERLTRLVGVEALLTYDDYADPEYAVHRNRADYTPHPLNAVVVRTWENRDYPDGGIVFLTNGTVSDPFRVFDDYDWRSVIENGIFKEAKHPWHLTHFPRKTEDAVIVHCFFTLTVMALCTAFRLWKMQDAPEDESTAQSHLRSPKQTTTVPLASTLLAGEGTERWRRRLRTENRDKVIVFRGERYGIFHVSAFAILAGLRIKPDGLPPELGTPADILAYYGLSP